MLVYLRLPVFPQAFRPIYLWPYVWPYYLIRAKWHYRGTPSPIFGGPASPLAGASGRRWFPRITPYLKTRPCPGPNRPLTGVAGGISLITQTGPGRPHNLTW